MTGTACRARGAASDHGAWYGDIPYTEGVDKGAASAYEIHDGTQPRYPRMRQSPVDNGMVDDNDDVTVHNDADTADEAAEEASEGRGREGWSGDLCSPR